mgnify:CR=1 FL=1
MRLPPRAELFLVRASGDQLGRDGGRRRVGVRRVGGIGASVFVGVAGDPPINLRELALRVGQVRPEGLGVCRSVNDERAEGHGVSVGVHKARDEDRRRVPGGGLDRLPVGEPVLCTRGADDAERGLQGREARPEVRVRRIEGRVLTVGPCGGEARLGNQQTNIAAHNLDYLNTQGSCGGTVTSENGRVFHLEPTKDCPQSYVIEAERLAAKIRNELNINVSGAFRERQRNLSAQINQIAREVGIEPHFVHAIISAESAYKPGARSHAGAMGLMQLMPGTARRFGVTDAYNTGQNITGGATYLKWLLNEFGGDMQLAAAGYNAGEGNVKKYGRKIPPFIETRAYVPKVMEYYRRYKANPSEIGL